MFINLFYIAVNSIGLVFVDVKTQDYCAFFVYIEKIVANKKLLFLRNGDQECLFLMLEVF